MTPVQSNSLINEQLADGWSWYDILNYADALDDVTMYIEAVRRSSSEQAACASCKGWSKMGGMSQYTNSDVIVYGRLGCKC